MHGFTAATRLAPCMSKTWPAYTHEFGATALRAVEVSLASPNPRGLVWSRMLKAWKPDTLEFGLCPNSSQPAFLPVGKPRRYPELKAKP